VEGAEAGAKTKPLRCLIHAQTPAPQQQHWTITTTTSNNNMERELQWKTSSSKCAFELPCWMLARALFHYTTEIRAIHPPCLGTPRHQAPYIRGSW
jgi:hypothetical protein